MATGTDTYMGMAVPLFGDFNIQGRTAANDIVTITQPASATGSPFVIKNSSGTTIFSINASGDIAGALQTSSTMTTAKGLTITTGDLTATAGDVQITKGYYLRFTSWPTTAPTTGVTLGDVCLMCTSTNVQLAIASAANTFRYLNTTSA